MFLLAVYWWEPDIELGRGSGRGGLTVGGAGGRGDRHRPGQHRVRRVRGGGLQDQAAAQVSIR